MSFSADFVIAAFKPEKTKRLFCVSRFSCNIYGNTIIVFRTNTLKLVFVFKISNA